MADSNRRQEILIGQARHLIDELDALRGQIDAVPDEILSTRPLEDEPSIKELYALIGLYDCEVYLPVLEAMVEGEQPLPPQRKDVVLLESASWNERPFPDVLEFVRQSRRKLVQFLETLGQDDWNTSGVVGDRNLTAFDLVYGLVQHEADLLRTAARLFHDSRLSP